MKKLSMLIAVFIAFASGVALQKYDLLNHFLSVEGSAINNEATSSAEKKPLYWVAPMDKNYRRDKPGKSPMGMDLVPVYEEDGQASDESVVKISPVVINNLGVRTQKVIKGKLDLPIQTVGHIGFDEDRLTHIHSRVDGWIEVLNVTSSGDPVKKGETLYELYSPALVNAQEEFLAAFRSGNNILKKASKSRLLSLGVTEKQISQLEKRQRVEQRIKVSAEQSGFVKALNVREGMFIKPATEVMSIGALDSVWVIAEVFERQAHWVKPGQMVEMTTAALPGRSWQGTVDYLYPVLDSKTRTLRVRVRVDNPAFELKPNMYADLTLMAPISESTLSIPREALIKGGRFSRVVKFLGDGKFKSALVKTGVEAGNMVQVLEGLSEGDQVVTSAQFLIDSESNIDAEIARMEAREAGGLESPADSGKSIRTTGLVTELMLDMDMLMVTHDPIPEWQWPSMNMSFTLAEPEKLPTLNNGDKINFKLTETEDGDYLVSDIEAVH